MRRVKELETFLLAQKKADAAHNPPFHIVHETGRQFFDGWLTFEEAMRRITP